MGTLMVLASAQRPQDPNYTTVVTFEADTKWDGWQANGLLNIGPLDDGNHVAAPDFDANNTEKNYTLSYAMNFNVC